MSEQQPLLNPEAHLEEVVERAYATFARYEKVSDFVGCACGTCVSAEENTAIHSKPLRELAPSDLSPLMTSAWFDTDDLKHFLPRMLEWVASGEPPDSWKVDHHAALATLTHYGEDWTTWPREEQRIVREFLPAWWAAVLQRETESERWYPDAEGAEETLTVIADVAGSVEPYLTVWEQTTSVPAIRHLKHMAEDNLQSVAIEGTLESPYWTGEAEQGVRAWLLSPARVAAVRGFHADVGEPNAQAYAALAEETADALVALQRVATDLEYFLNEYWGRRFEQYAGSIAGVLSMEAAAARVNPPEGLWHRRPREMRRVLDWLSEPGRMDEMRRVAAARGWHPTALNALDEVPMLQRVLDGELPPPMVWPSGPSC